jgi:IS1 family transposase
MMIKKEQKIEGNNKKKSSQISRLKKNTKLLNNKLRL